MTHFLTSTADFFNFLKPLTLSFILVLINIYFTLQVTHELLDKVGEVETNLQSHSLFQDRMNKMTDWVVSTNQTIMTRGLNPGQALVCRLKSSQDPTTLEHP